MPDWLKHSQRSIRTADGARSCTRHRIDVESTRSYQSIHRHQADDSDDHCTGAHSTRPQRLGRVTSYRFLTPVPARADSLQRSDPGRRVVHPGELEVINSGESLCLPWCCCFGCGGPGFLARATETIRMLCPHGQYGTTHQAMQFRCIRRLGKKH